MNDSAHHGRDSERTPPPAETGSIRASGSSSWRKVGKSLPDQPTVITSTLPIPAPASSDAASRILEGRVMPGDRIGHFDLVDYVGGGGMGRVFRAIDTQLGRVVAVKVLPPDQAAGADALQRFQNEAQSSARLDHENIARVYFVGEDQGLAYIVFEFIEGVNVRLLVEQKGPLPLDEALSYTIQVAEALAHADSRGVVHRDIKPSNVLITPEGRVKLIDMGLARLRNGDPATADLTQSGVTLGTFDYISPEQARDPRNADIRSDIYSLGCTMFFMLAAQPPFPDGTVLQKLLQHQGDQPPEIRQLRPDLPEEISPVLRKMMAKDPRHRYASSTELATDLLTLAGQIGLRPVIPTSRVWLTPPEESVSFFRRHLPWMAPVAALLCIVLLVDRLTPREDVAPPPIDVVGKNGVERGKSEDRVGDKSPAKKEDLKKETAKAAPTKTDAIGTSATKKADGAKALPPSGTFAAPSTVRTSLLPFLPTDDLERKSPFSPNPSADLPMSPLDSGGFGVAAKDAERRAFAADRPVADLPSKRSGTLIVSESPVGENEFSSLGAACNFAQNGDTIELHFTGVRKEQPIRLLNRQVTVCAGKGYQPVLVFQPTETDLVSPRSMFSLTAGRLTMADVAVVLYVPRDVLADNWAMFESCGGQTIQMDRCSLTVCNASSQLATYHPEVAFIRAKRAADADADNSTAATPLATIELNDCIARGEAAFLAVEELQPVSLVWENGLLATTEHLLTVAGGQAASKSNEMLRLDLRHVTAAVRSGLCRLSASPANPYQLAVYFASRDNIIMTAGEPLVEQEGMVSLENSRQQFDWKGDRNYYQDIDVFWRVRYADSRIAPDVKSFDEWKKDWGPSRENQPSRKPIAWRQGGGADRALHAQTPADYAPEDPTFNDASNGAPGFRAHRLPPLPKESR